MISMSTFKRHNLCKSLTDNEHLGYTFLEESKWSKEAWRANLLAVRWQQQLYKVNFSGTSMSAYLIESLNKSKSNALSTIKLPVRPQCQIHNTSTSRFGKWRRTGLIDNSIFDGRCCLHFTISIGPWEPLFPVDFMINLKGKGSHEMKNSKQNSSRRHEPMTSSGKNRKLFSFNSMQ